MTHSRVSFGGAIICFVWAFIQSSASGQSLVEVHPDVKYFPGIDPAVAIHCADDGQLAYLPPSFDPARQVERDGAGLMRGVSDGFDAFISTGWTPPDPEIAAGPNHVVVIVNGGVAFFQHDGTLDFSQSINGSAGFWGEVGATNFVFDPEATFDPGSGRFFVMANERTDPSGFEESFFVLAVSDDDDPNGTWHKYRFDVTAEGGGGAGGGSIDSPNMAISGDAVYLGADFTFNGRYMLFVVEKAAVLSGAAPATTNTIFFNAGSSGLPRIIGDPPKMYMIHNPTNQSVRLSAVVDPLTTPTRVTFDLAVPPYELGSEAPPQMGGSAAPTTFGSRFWSCEWRDGSLWAVHHQNTTRVLARWYEIHTNGWPDSGSVPTLAQSGEIDPGPEIRTFFPAIGSDECGNAMVIFARSSPSEFISFWAAARHANDPPGTLRPPFLVRETTAHYAFPRWGDYGGIEADPVTGERYWTHHEYTLDGMNWLTWVAPLAARPRGDLTGDDAVTLSDVDPFAALLLDDDPAASESCTADMNRDGELNAADVGPFISRILE